MAKPLHHRAMRYEVQIYIPHRMSWTPVAHDVNEGKAILLAQTLAKNGSTHRVLDRKDGVSRAVEVMKFTGKK